MRYESKQALLDAITTEHDRLCARLDAIPKSRYREAGVWGDGWTVSDLVAHLAEWQEMFLRWYAEGSTGGTPAMPAPGYKWNELPRLNRAIWTKHRCRSAAAARRDFELGYQRIVTIVEGLSAEQLLAPGHFAWTGRNSLTTYLGANTASHYRFATKVLKRWVAAGAERAVPTRRPDTRWQPTAPQKRRRRGDSSAEEDPDHDSPRRGRARGVSRRRIGGKRARRG